MLLLYLNQIHSSNTSRYQRKPRTASNSNVPSTDRACYNLSRLLPTHSAAEQRLMPSNPDRFGSPLSFCFFGSVMSLKPSEFPITIYTTAEPAVSLNLALPGLSSRFFPFLHPAHPYPPTLRTRRRSIFYIIIS